MLTPMTNSFAELGLWVQLAVQLKLKKGSLGVWNVQFKRWEIGVLLLSKDSGDVWECVLMCIFSI